MSGPKCIVCGIEGLPVLCTAVPVQPKGCTRTVRMRNGGLLLSGDLAHAYMVGPSSPPSNFPGDLTGKVYYGSGASAHIYYHPECNGLNLDAYNDRVNVNVDSMMADDETYAYAADKPSNEGPWKRRCFPQKR